MDKSKKNITILILKKNQNKLLHSSSQTISIREKTNQTIRVLGNKYYNVKSLFDKLNLQRDSLFNLGRALEIQYKEEKPGIHIPTSSKRMKDSIICWYASFFYEEIFTPNSKVFNQLLAISKQLPITLPNNKKIAQKQKKSHEKAKNSECNMSNKDHEIPVVISEEESSAQENMLNLPNFQKLTMNEEIDKYEFGNDIKDSPQGEHLFEANNINISNINQMFNY